MIKLAIAGATGRTGKCVLERAIEDPLFDVVAAITVSDDPLCGTMHRVGSTEVPLVDQADSEFDVLIDFTLPAGTMKWLDFCKRANSAMVSGVTGHTEEQLAQIRDSAKTIPILLSSNFSVGVNLLLQLVGSIASQLGEQYDVEIVESHHRRKVDSPSGTAMSLLREIANATDRSVDQDAVFGRHGELGPRPSREIGVHAVRMGDVVGKHEIHFSGPGETISLTHTAHSRDTFAAGALRAAQWLVQQKPGFYSIWGGIP